MSDQHHKPPFPLRRDLGVAVGVTVAAAALTAAVLALAGFSAHLGPMAAAAAICFLGSILSLLAMAWRAPACDEGVVQGAMIGIMARLGICLAGGAALVLLTPWARGQVAAWTLGWYLFTLILDVFILVRYTRRIDRVDGNPANGRSAASMTEVHA